VTNSNPALHALTVRLVAVATVQALVAATALHVLVPKVAMLPVAAKYSSAVASRAH
jgi:hypothetical protein